MQASRFSLLVAVVVLLIAGIASADSVTFTGTLSSDNSALGVDSYGNTDPIFPDTASIAYGNTFSLTLNYDPANYSQNGDSYSLADATLTGWFGSAMNAVAYSSDAVTNNYLAVNSPGAYGSGTVSFQFCTSSDCANDYMNLYFTGSIGSLSSMASDASGLTADSSASPSEFEFLRNYATPDGSSAQTDLMGTLDPPSGSTPAPPAQVPEPATLTLLASGLATGWLRRRKQ